MEFDLIQQITLAVYVTALSTKTLCPQCSTHIHELINCHGNDKLEAIGQNNNCLSLSRDKTVFALWEKMQCNFRFDVCQH